jgi:hypothetical protein
MNRADFILFIKYHRKIWIFANYCLSLSKLEDRLHLENTKKNEIFFGILLDLHYLWLRRRYSRSKKLKKYLFFCSLIRIFAT